MHHSRFQTSIDPPPSGAIPGWRCPAWVIMALLLAAVAPARSQSARKTDVYDVARQFEIQPLSEKPTWAEPEAPPLLTFAWISDCHLTAGTRYSMIKTGFNLIRDHIQPDFVVITGDNSAYAGNPAAETAGLSRARRRQLAFKHLLDTELGLPAAIIPGDNWPQEFEAVFGSDRYSFDAGGLRFVFVSPDAYAKGVEGCAVFDESTWQWLVNDLTANRDRPIILFMHHNVVPPTFLESSRIQALLLDNPQVVATMTGHLHLDLEFTADDVTHLIGPSMGVAATLGFKIVRLYRDRLVLNTYEYREKSKSFEPTLKWQKIDIAMALRDALHPLDADRLFRTRRSELPPRPQREEQALLERRGELFMPMMTFLVQFGAGQLNRTAPAR